MVGFCGGWQAGIFSIVKLIGIDTGGTFTDFVLADGASLKVHKVLSTPQAPEQAILQGVADLGLDPAGLRVIHGSTVATNAALEGKGARTLYIGNRGLADVLNIGRQARRELYQLQPPPRRPPAPPAWCLETGGRLGADGRPVEPLEAQDIARLLQQLRPLRPEAVAINLLFSYLDDSAERALEAAMPEGVFVARSSQVLPIVGEYERGVATWLNAWLGPLVTGYLGRLRQGLPAANLNVMQSSGEAIDAGQAARQAVRMLLSGPAGGLVGARFVAAKAGRQRLLSFDMGGTSTDVALLEGAPRLTTEGRIGEWPVAVPMVDMHTIGAGGGSIARLDAGGMLLVGPASAGADPGPACYGRGGQEPTVTDANLLLGRLSAADFLGGRMPLERAAAAAAVGRLAARLGKSAEDTALGIVRIANAHMAQALRVISVQRGVDPRGYTLVSFGGAGGLHVCALADALRLRQAMVPVQAGVLSALGMLASRPGRQLSRAWPGLLQRLAAPALSQQLAILAEQGRQALLAEGVDASAIEVRQALDLRYRGQSYTLPVAWRGDSGEAARDFAAQHVGRYGHGLDLPVELVNLRVAVSAPALPFELPAPARAEATVCRQVPVHGIAALVPVFQRQRLAAGWRVSGPAIIAEAVATTWLAPGWDCEMDSIGNLLLQCRR